MKRLVVLFSLIFFGTFLFGEKITVVTEDYAPFNYVEDGVVKGIGTEVVKEILKRAKIDYSLKAYPWARAYKMAQEKENTLIYSMGRSKERESMFKWVAQVIPFDVYLFSLKSNTKVNIASIDDAKKYKIGGVKNDVRAQYLEKHGCKIDYANSDVFNIKKLYAKRVDLVAFDLIGGAYQVKQGGYDFSKLKRAFYLKDVSSGLYMAFSKKTSDKIVNKCKKAFDSMVKDGTYKKIKEKYIK